MNDCNILDLTPLSASHLKQTTQARNAWLAQHLHMGRTEALSSHVAKHRRGRLNA